jgi:hypothetical protein
MALKTRRPTGRAPWPFVLFEGPEKVGKTFSALLLSASERVGRTFAFDLGEGSLDEYLPLGPFEIVDHDGSLSDLLEQLGEAMAVPMDPAKPNVIVIDGGTHLWEALKSEADATARARLARKNRAVAADQEVQITMDLWNTAAAKWRRVIGPLLTWPGIVVITCRGGEVAAVENGRPVEGKKDWAVQAHKSLVFDASVIVRFVGHRKAVLTGARSLALQVPEGETLPLPDFTLEDLIFNKMGLSGENTGTRQMTIANTADAVTDTEWLEKWRARVAMTDDLDELRTLFVEAVAAYKDQRLSHEDRGHCDDFINRRKAQIEEAAAQPVPDVPTVQGGEEAQADEQRHEPEPDPVMAPDGSDQPDPAVPQPVQQAMTRLRQAMLTQLEQAGVDIETAAVERFGVPLEQVETRRLSQLMPEKAGAR